MGLVRMIIDGPYIQHQSEVVEDTTRTVLDISTPCMFNSVEYGQDTDSSHGLNNYNHDILLTLYVALRIYVCCHLKKNTC